MVGVHVVRDAGGRITAFSITGHAGAASHGEDVVCAAVSMLAQATVIGLRERLGIQPDVRVKKGDLDCRLPPDLPPPLAERAQDLLETMVLALRNVAGQPRYRKFVRITEETAP